MVRIRLRRMGAKKKPFYRIVVANQQAARNGGFIENIGTYDPMSNPETVTLEHERAAHWLSVGAQPSEAVARLLRSRNLLGEDGKAISPTSAAVVETPPIPEAVVEAEPAAEDEAVAGDESAVETESAAEDEAVAGDETAVEAESSDL